MGGNRKKNARLAKMSRTDCTSGEIDTNSPITSTLDENRTVTLSLDELRLVVGATVSQLVDSLKSELAQRFDDIDNQFSDINRLITSKCDDVIKGQLALTNELPALRESSLTNNLTGKTSSTPATEVQTTSLQSAHEVVDVEEALVRQEKKNNLVLFGVLESNGTECERIQHDTKILNQVCKAINVEEPVKIASISRKGRTVDGKPRIVVVKFHENDTNKRLNILRNAKNLKNLINENPLKKIYIKPDLTWRQQQKDKDLRAEVKRRRENNEDVVIKKGEVVPREVSTFHQQ